MAVQEYGRSLNQTEAVLKQDTIMTILARVEQLINNAESNESRLGAISDKLGGASTLENVEPNPGPSPASHVIFTAARIEQELSAHIRRTADLISRLENMI